jgi:DNA-binding MarR family transcriptional regulator
MTLVSNSVEAEDRHLWGLLNTVYHLICRYRTTELKPLKVTREQVRLIGIIKYLGPKATMPQISQSMHLKHNSVSTSIKRMETAGLVFKEVNNHTNIIKLTEKGMKTYHDSKEMESIHRVMSKLNSKERRQMQSSLNTLLESVKCELAAHESKILQQNTKIIDVFDEENNQD